MTEQNIYTGDYISLQQTGLTLYHDVLGVSSLVSAICSDRIGGEPLRQNITSLAQAMGQTWKSQTVFEQDDNGVVIGIPRGGVHMGNGLHNLVPHYTHIDANQGLQRVADKPVVSLDHIGAQAKHVLIGDTALFTGRTVAKTLEAVSTQVSPETHILVFIAIAYLPGIMQLVARFPHVDFSVAHVETETRPVYNPQYWRVFQTLANVGDIGQLVSK